MRLYVMHLIEYTRIKYDFLLTQQNRNTKYPVICLTKSVIYVCIGTPRLKEDGKELLSLSLSQG